MRAPIVMTKRHWVNTAVLDQFAVVVITNRVSGMGSAAVTYVRITPKMAQAVMRVNGLERIASVDVEAWMSRVHLARFASQPIRMEVQFAKPPNGRG